MVTTLGTILGTTLGTELVDFIDPATLPQFDATKLYSLTNYGLGHTYASGAGGGEVGTSAGFGVLTLNIVERIPTGAQTFVGRSTTGQGYLGNIDPVAPGFVVATMRDGTGGTLGTRLTSGFALSPSDVGKVLPVIVSHSGALIGCAGWDGSIRRTAPIVGFTPATALPMVMGTGAANVALAPFALLAYRGTPTDAQLQAVLREARALGDVPAKAAAEAVMPGTTVTHRWSLRDVLAAANVAVTTGTVAPATIPDSVTAASVDSMARSGSPTVTVIDPSIDGRLSYGVLGLSTTSRLETVNPGGTAGADTGFWVGGWFNPRVLSGNQTIIGRGDASTGGYHLYLSGSALQIAGRSSSGSNIADTPSTTLTAGMPVHAMAWLDGASTWHLAVNGVEVGTPLVSAVGYRPYAGPMTLGSLGTLFPASGVDIYGGGAGMGAISLAQVQESARATIAAGRWVSPAHGNSYDLTTDIIANGGPTAGVPATVQDRVGSDHLTRVGTGLQVAQRAERLWSYETAPILYGADGWTLSDYFEAAINAMPGDPAGFTASILCSVRQNVASVTRRVLSQQGATNPGWAFATTGLNTAMIFGANGVNSPSSSIAAADAGKLMLFTGVVDATAGLARMYAKRVQVATGSALASYVADPAVAATIGKRAGGSPADGVTVYGFSYAVGIPTLAQVQAQFDAVVASERIQHMPSLPGVLIDLTQDAVGGVLPATLTDRGAGGVNFTKTGSPTASAQYARAWTW